MDAAHPSDGRAAHRDTEAAGTRPARRSRAAVGTAGRDALARGAARAGRGRAGSGRRRCAGVRRVRAGDRRTAARTHTRGCRSVPLDLTDLVAPAHTALVLQEVQNGVVGSPSVLPALAGCGRGGRARRQLRAARGRRPCRRHPGVPLHGRDARRRARREPQRAAVPRREQGAGALVARERRGAASPRRSVSRRKTSCCRATTGSVR